MSNMTETVLTRSTTKLVIDPVEHFAGSRLTRRTWTAAVTLRDDETVRVECGHWGHPTTDAAIKCGTRIWKRLP